MIDLATNSFGQNFNVTMTQMVSAFSSLVNGGYYYEPHVVKQIQDEDGNVIETKDRSMPRLTSGLGEISNTPFMVLSMMLPGRSSDFS